MKTYATILFSLFCFTILSCTSLSTISTKTNAEVQKKLPCENLVWYNFINGKPSRYYLASSQKVAERWGFEIAYSLGSCTNNEEDKKKDSINKQKSIPVLKCLTENYGENWQTIFHKEVKTYINNK